MLKFLELTMKGNFSCSFLLSILKPFKINGHLLNTSVHIVLGVMEKWWPNNQIGSYGDH